MKELLNTISNPGIFLFPLLAIFLYIILIPRAWSVRTGAVFFFTVGVLFTCSLSDNNFREIASEPDNFPAGMLLILFAFFLWVSLLQAHENDRRASLKMPPVESKFREKVATWPDLVYIELISMVLLTAILIAWSLLADAPLEEWANPTISPNPSKAPWYFLGLQELLVYFDPWIAGVVIPLLIIFGLIAIPYIDSSPQTSGYYSLSGRKFATLFFLGGFFFWIILIFIGTYLRGQNWSFYGPFENRALLKHDVIQLTNLSDIVWHRFLAIETPKHWLPREIFGIALVFSYLILLPLLTRKLLAEKKPKVWAKSGIYRSLVDFVQHFKPARGQRHFITLLLFLLAGGILIKMLLRLLFHVKYIVTIPEFLLNI